MTEFTISQYDMEVLRHQQAEAKRRHERTIARIQQTSYVAFFVSVAATVLGLSWIVWQASTDVSDEDRAENEIRLACIDAGGSWVRVGGGDRDSSTYGTCFGQPIEVGK